MQQLKRRCRSAQLRSIPVVAVLASALWVAACSDLTTVPERSAPAGAAVLGKGARPGGGTEPGGEVGVMGGETICIWLPGHEEPLCGTAPTEEDNCADDPFTEKCGWHAGGGSEPPYNPEPGGGGGTPPGGGNPGSPPGEQEECAAGEECEEAAQCPSTTPVAAFWASSPDRWIMHEGAAQMTGITRFSVNYYFVAFATIGGREHVIEGTGLLYLPDCIGSGTKTLRDIKITREYWQ